MPTPSETFTEIVTTTDRNWSNRVVDGVTNHNAFLRFLKRKGKIKNVSGGYEIARQFAYNENGTYQRMFGYDQLNTSASDTLTTIKQPFEEISLSITASGRELLMNSGEEQMLDLIEERKNIAISSAANQFSVDLYSDGTLTNQINGLAQQIQVDGLGTVGGIDASVYTTWRNKFREMTGTNTAASPSEANSASMKADMQTLYTSCERGADSVDLILMSQDFYSLYWLGEHQLQRYADADLANAGFRTLKFMGADVIHDNNTNFASTAERAYFLNCNTWELVQHRQAKWTMEDKKMPVNQNSVIIPMFWMGNLVTVNRRLNGILFDAA